MDAGDNKVFPCKGKDLAGELQVGGSGEQERGPVERLNDIHVIPQSGCWASTATRTLLHLSSSAPSTEATGVRRVTELPV